MRSSTALLACCLALLLSGCKEAAVYSQESFAADSPFKLRVKDPVDAACESTRRALLGQGYLIDDASADKVRGHKAYMGSGDRNSQIEMNVVCIKERQGSTLYVTGVLSSYELKTSGSAASVGVSAVGSISLPIGRSADSLVKVGEQTITDAEFYRRFFSAVELTLAEIGEADEPAQPETKPSIAVENGPEPASLPEPAPASVVTEPASPPPPGIAESVLPAAAPVTTGGESSLPIPGDGPVTDPIQSVDTPSTAAPTSTAVPTAVTPDTGIPATETTTAAPAAPAPATPAAGAAPSSADSPPDTWTAPVEEDPASLFDAPPPPP